MQCCLMKKIIKKSRWSNGSIVECQGNSLLAKKQFSCKSTALCQEICADILLFLWSIHGNHFAFVAKHPKDAIYYALFGHHQLIFNKLYWYMLWIIPHELLCVCCCCHGPPFCDVAPLSTTLIKSSRGVRHFMICLSLFYIFS